MLCAITVHYLCCVILDVKREGSQPVTPESFQNKTIFEEKKKNSLAHLARASDMKSVHFGLRVCQVTALYFTFLCPIKNYLKGVFSDTLHKTESGHNQGVTAKSFQNKDIL